MRYFIPVYILIFLLTGGLFPVLLRNKPAKLLSGKLLTNASSVNPVKTHKNKTLPANKTPVVDRSDTSTITIPLKRIGKLFLIEATIDGESGNLVFDTGASSLVLNTTYFRNHVSFGERTTGGITGSIGTVERVTVDHLNIGSLKFKSVFANLSNLGHIENSRGIKILGLFGFELIKQYEIRIDYASNRLRLFPMDKKGNLLNPTAAFNGNYIQKIEALHNILFMKASIGGKLLRFCFDTGAETNVLSSDLPKAVLQTVTITRTSKLRGAGASFSDAFYGRMTSFVFGDSAFTNMETVITYLDHLNESYGTNFDGVAGFDFISKGTFCINFVKQQMGIAYFNTEEQ